MQHLMPVQDDAIAFETLQYSLSLVRKARAAMNKSPFEASPSQGEVNFHLGCAEIALLRLLLEEERNFNEASLVDEEERLLS